jgi:signal transduction histidine kinase
MEVEITDIPALSPAERCLLGMHSLLNILNVLQGELTVIGLTLADDPELLQPALAVCNTAKASFTDERLGLQFAENVGQHLTTIRENLAAALQQHPAKAQDPEIAESLANTESVFAVLEVRAREILARAREPDRWVTFTIDYLRRDLMEVFAAIERNSHGRYRILYNLARQENVDYYVDLSFESATGGTIVMPPVFKDVIRDLLANARKYTQPGGTINAGLYESADELRFSVQDSGCGIPASELQTVVHYGKRGSNVMNVRTMGAGFGLTKAFFVTKQFGGRFWVKSELDLGTRIRIVIPRPASAKTAPPFAV